MNYPFPTTSPYMQAAMAQAVQAIMSGAQLSPNCLVMRMPFQQVHHQMLPQMMVNPAMQQGAKYFGQPQMSLYTNNSQPSRPHAPYPQNYNNYQIVLRKNSNTKSKKKPHEQQKQQHQQQPHSNIYDSSSFDSYMHHLSWSRLFDHHPRKNSKQQPQLQQKQDESAINLDEKSDTSKKERLDSSDSSTSSTTSDETIRRVNVANKQLSNISSKQQTKGSLPFKYSSEYIPGIGKQQSQNIKSTDVFILNKA